jgi:hypothetical protein
MESLIRNSNLTKQGLDFTGLQNGAIHPSDIDAVLEFDNEALILIEVKKQGSKIPLGQRLLLERLCNSWHTKKAIVLYVTHNFKDETIDIPIEKCKVSAAYYGREWTVKPKIPLPEALNKLGKSWNIDKLKF